MFTITYRLNGHLCHYRTHDPLHARQAMRTVGAYLITRTESI